jgi:hypothetical protein
VRRLLAFAVALLAFGCSAEADEGDRSEDEVGTAQQRTVCFGGRTVGDPFSVGGIKPLADMCQQMPGLIRDVPNGPDAKFSFFQWNSDLGHVLDVIVAALDTNRDGNVTNADAAADLTFVGYSWGGFNARDVAAAIGSDRRFSPLRKPVKRLVVLDAYQTEMLIVPKPDLRVPGNVRFFESFRHSVGPDDDCSKLVPGLLGPFTGRQPLCTGATVCKDFDYSLAPATAGVDHCEVVAQSRNFVLNIVNGRPSQGLPPERPVRRF